MPAGAPSLGTNLSFDPFRETRRRQPQQRQQPQAEQWVDPHNGFSQDGLSYSVINDFDKLAAQALAEYDAALAAERQKGLSIDSRGIVTAKPVDDSVSQNLYNQIVEPINLLMGRPSPGGRSTPQNRVFEMGGQLVEWDPSTRTAKAVWGEGRGGGSMPLDLEQKSRLKLIEDEIIDTRKLAEKEEDFDRKIAYQNRLVTLERNRRKIFEQPAATMAAQPEAPVQAAPKPTPRGFIGTPGGENRFAGQPLAQATQPAAAPAPPTTTPAGSGSRFSITTVSGAPATPSFPPPFQSRLFDSPPITDMGFNQPTKEIGPPASTTAFGTPAITDPLFWKNAASTSRSGAQKAIGALNLASDALAPRWDNTSPRGDFRTVPPSPEQNIIAPTEREVLKARAATKRRAELAEEIRNTPDQYKEYRDMLVREYVSLAPEVMNPDLYTSPRLP